MQDDNTPGISCEQRSNLARDCLSVTNLLLANSPPHDDPIGVSQHALIATLTCPHCRGAVHAEHELQRLHLQIDVELSLICSHFCRPGHHWVSSARDGGGQNAERVCLRLQGLLGILGDCRCTSLGCIENCRCKCQVESQSGLHNGNSRQLARACDRHN